jgi:4-hydroxythreonine-4-phosphate dehydrogenase
MLKKGYKNGVIVTTGDPAGIGPEIIVKSLASEHLRKQARIFVVGEARALGLYCDSKFIRTCSDLNDYKWQYLNLIPVSELKELSAGQPTVDTARSSVKALEMARDIVSGEKDFALVTGPIHKKGLQDVGFNFPGHTEFLGDRSGCTVLMMFWGRKFKVATLTTHCSLREVPDKITSDAVKEAIAIADHGLKKLFRIKKPRITVLGLNPHAGESGKLGIEEQTIILPACEEMKARGFNVKGPVPADAAFYYALKGSCDIILGMYHDQVLGPFKMQYFEEGVNLTLGLPYIRTSPDHGTAFDIAGKGIASETSMKNAITLAVELLKEREIHEN